MSFSGNPAYVFVYRIGRGESEVATIELAADCPATRETAVRLFRDAYGEHAEIRRIIEHRIEDGVKTQRDVTEEES